MRCTSMFETDKARGKAQIANCRRYGSLFLALGLAVLAAGLWFG